MASLSTITIAGTAYNITGTYTTCSLGTTWSGSAPNFSQAVRVSGVSANSSPTLDVLIASNATQADIDAANENWGKVYAAVTSDANGGTITFYATEKTTAAITVQVKGF